MTAKNIVVYSQEGWIFCSKVKEYLSQKGIQFAERDVSKDTDAVNDLKKMGVMTTPVTVINGEIVIGFDQQKLEQLLNSWEILM